MTELGDQKPWKIKVSLPPYQGKNSGPAHTLHSEFKNPCYQIIVMPFVFILLPTHFFTNIGADLDKVPLPPLLKSLLLIKIQF